MKGSTLLAKRGNLMPQRTSLITNESDGSNTSQANSPMKMGALRINVIHPTTYSPPLKGKLHLLE